ncbi:MAG: hypothetical protein AAF488_15105 [Planctomycetota bacterium]
MVWSREDFVREVRRQLIELESLRKKIDGLAATSTLTDASTSTDASASTAASAQETARDETDPKAAAARESLERVRESQLYVLKKLDRLFDALDSGEYPFNVAVQNEEVRAEEPAEKVAPESNPVTPESAASTAISAETSIQNVAQDAPESATDAAVPEGATETESLLSADTLLNEDLIHKDVLGDDVLLSDEALLSEAAPLELPAELADILPDLKNAEVSPLDSLPGKVPASIQAYLQELLKKTGWLEQLTKSQSSDNAAILIVGLQQGGSSNQRTPDPFGDFPTPPFSLN